MEEGEFSEAREQISCIQKDYEEAVADTVAASDDDEEY